MSGVALVAGASRGLGLLVCAELVARGYRVHGCARDAAELERARELLATGSVGPLDASSDPSTRGRFTGHICDVTDAEAVTAWVDEVHESESSIDVAIHVAGIIQVGPVEAATLGHFRAAVDTMLMGPVNLCLAVLPAMLEAERGRIGVVTSVGGVVAAPHLLPYSVAKFGAVGLTEGLHAELSGTGVTATTIVPGLMRTGAHVKAQFVGDAPKDYAWFAPGASPPLLSVSAERAARRRSPRRSPAGRTHAAHMDRPPGPRAGTRDHVSAPGFGRPRPAARRCHRTRRLRRADDDLDRLLSCRGREGPPPTRLPRGERTLHARRPGVGPAQRGQTLITRSVRIAARFAVRSARG